MTRRTALLAAVLVATGALLVSTGAVPLSDGTDDVSGVEVEMSPADGPNGKYAVLNDAGEIELLLSDENPYLNGSGVTDNTVTPLDRVFTVTNTGTEPARVWITDDAADVRFYRGDDPDDSLEGATNDIELLPDETVAVGLLVDARGDHDVESASGFTVHVEQRTPDDGSADVPDQPEDSEDDPVQPEPVPTEPSTTSGTETPSTAPSTDAPTTPETTTSTTTPEPGDGSTTPEPGDGSVTTSSGPSGPTSGETTTASEDERLTVTTERSTADDSLNGPLAEIGSLDPAGVLGVVVLLALVLTAVTAYRRLRAS